MAWVRFSRVFNYTPSRERRVTLSYRPDGATQGVYSVTKGCADKAVAEGAAERIRTPPRGPDATQ